MEPPAGRVIDIFVRDDTERLVEGPEISFMLDGQAAGGVDYAEGRARIHLPDRKHKVGVTVRIGRRTQTKELGPNQDSYEFVFHARRRTIAKVAAVPVLLIAAAVFAANRGWISLGDPSPFQIDARYAGEAPHRREFIVVFVHGILGAADTWRNGADTFPNLLISDPAFADRVDVFVFEYFSPRFGDAGSIVDLADQLRGELQDDGVLEGRRGIVFVAHSMGGLVTRKLLLARRELVPQVKFLYFYATPTNGAELASLAGHISANPQLRGMLPVEGNDLLQAIHSDWQNAAALRELPSYCAFELLPTAGATVVSRSSATALCNREPDPISANHLDIVKPVGRGDPRYTRFATHLRAMLAADDASPNR